MGVVLVESTYQYHKLLRPITVFLGHFEGDNLTMNALTIEANHFKLNSE